MGIKIDGRRIFPGAGKFDIERDYLSLVTQPDSSEVLLCFQAGIGNVPFASIMLHTGNALDAETVFRDASTLGDEIVSRFNSRAQVCDSCEHKIDGEYQHECLSCSRYFSDAYSPSNEFEEKR